MGRLGPGIEVEVVSFACSKHLPRWICLGTAMTPEIQPMVQGSTATLTSVVLSLLRYQQKLTVFGHLDIFKVQFTSIYYLPLER